MSIHQLEVSGNLRSQQTEILKADYTKILSTVWNKEPLWKHIQNKTLTTATCMVGREYDRSPVKLMFVGRAVKADGNIKCDKARERKMIFDSRGSHLFFEKRW